MSSPDARPPPVVDDQDDVHRLAGRLFSEVLRRLRHAVLRHPDIELHDDATGLLLGWRGGSAERLVPATVL